MVKREENLNPQKRKKENLNLLKREENLNPLKRKEDLVF